MFYLKVKIFAPLILVLMVLTQARKTAAYPSFIGYGYTSCIVCHFNPLGNGPLTDYGRALGATAIAAKPFYNLKASDEDLGNQSAFLLGKKILPEFLRAQINYRAMSNTVGIGSGSSASTRFINMQMGASVIAKGLNDRLIAVINGGLLPPSASGADGVGFISREQYVSYAVTRKVRAYVGLMDVAYGIRTPDHVAASRFLNKVAQNDQVHGVLVHVGTKKAEYAMHAFAGNLYQTPAKVRPTGGSFTFEIDAAEKVRLGASGLFSKSGVRDRKLLALHSRVGFGKGSSVLAETGFVLDTPKNAPTLFGNYLYTQSMTRLFRGFHFLFTAEYTTKDAFKPNPRVFKVGPSLQFFATGFSEFRLDFWGQRTMGKLSDYDTADSYQLLGQLHLWF